MRIHRIAVIVTAAALTIGSASARAGATFSPYAGKARPTRVYWGDEHIHTGWSADAGGFGCTLSPEDALRFARGEEVNVLPRAAGEAVAAARLGRRHRPLGRRGRDLRDPRRQSGADEEPDAQEVARHDAGREGDRSGFGADRRAVDQDAARRRSRTRSWPPPCGARTRRSWRSTTSPAASRRSSATSGPATRAAATTCTAT